MSDAEVEVRDVPERNRYEVHVDGGLAGFADYELRDGRRWFVHTEVDDRFEGKGIGSQLAQRALELARDSGEPIVPACPFIASYVERHPEFEPLVDRERTPPRRDGD